TDWQLVAKKAVEWPKMAEARTALFVLVQRAGADQYTPESFAGACAGDVTSRLGACATATVDGAQVTYTFAGCDAPLGITGLRGTIHATYSLKDGNHTGDYFDVEMKGENVAINGSTITFDIEGGNMRPRSYWQAEPDAVDWISFEEVSATGMNP